MRGCRCVDRRVERLGRGGTVAAALGVDDVRRLDQPERLFADRGRAARPRLRAPGQRPDDEPGARRRRAVLRHDQRRRGGRVRRERLRALAPERGAAGARLRAARRLRRRRDGRDRPEDAHALRRRRVRAHARVRAVQRGGAAGLADSPVSGVHRRARLGRADAGRRVRLRPGRGLLRHPADPRRNPRSRSRRPEP